MIKTRIIFLVVVEDYHDIGMIADAIQGVELSWREVGMSGPDYVGVIFDGCSPGDGEIADLILDADVTLTD
jgi:hypothetical protein